MGHVARSGTVADQMSAGLCTQIMCGCVDGCMGGCGCVCMCGHVCRGVTVILLLYAGVHVSMCMSAGVCVCVFLCVRVCVRVCVHEWRRVVSTCDAHAPGPPLGTVVKLYTFSVVRLCVCM